MLHLLFMQRFRVGNNFFMFWAIGYIYQGYIFLLLYQGYIYSYLCIKNTVKKYCPILLEL